MLTAEVIATRGKFAALKLSNGFFGVGIYSKHRNRIITLLHSDLANEELALRVCEVKKILQDQIPVKYYKVTHNYKTVILCHNDVEIRLNNYDDINESIFIGSEIIFEKAYKIDKKSITSIKPSTNLQFIYTYEELRKFLCLEENE